MKENQLLPLTILLLFTAIIVASCKKDECPSPPQNLETPEDTTSIDTTSVEPVDSINLLRLNQLQIIGSHNSYRKRTYEPVYNFVQGISFLLPAEYNPDGWDYDHVSLSEQLQTYGIRKFEIDIYNDPQGGQFYERKSHTLIGESTASNIAELQEPGFKVLHIPDFDYETHHYTFVDALQTIKAWSDANPNHVPIIIQIESKEGTVADVLTQFDLTESIPFDAAAADALDEEIKSVFGNELTQVFSPDELKGNFSSLDEAVLNDAWPTLGELRGQVLFAMQGSAVSHYKSGHPSLNGRAMFVFAEPGQPEAAFVIRNNPINDEQEITALVEQGYIVRTRSDENTNQARSGDYSWMNAAFNSGAQIISTDYYRPDPRHASSSEWTDYQVQFSSGQRVRINPISAEDFLHLGEVTE